jgi:phosphopantothenoylcysteine decarboxylase
MSVIVLGVTGSIAAYKAADIANVLTKRGHEVKVILTAAGAKFITELTLQTLTKQKVYRDIFDEDVPREVKHISLAKGADVLVIAPASADMIAKVSLGIADDLLSSVALALDARTPVVIAPAMNTNMWLNLATRENMDRLRARGYAIVEPKEAILACGDLGKGADVDVILAAIDAALGKSDDGNA